jgi:hypothetical protein
VAKRARPPSAVNERAPTSARADDARRSSSPPKNNALLNHRHPHSPRTIHINTTNPTQTNTTTQKTNSFKNGLCQLPVYRKPWEHVISALAGAAVFEYVQQQEESMVRQIERRYAEMGGGGAAAEAKK